MRPLALSYWASNPGMAPSMLMRLNIRLEFARVPQNIKRQRVAFISTVKPQTTIPRESAAWRPPLTASLTPQTSHGNGRGKVGDPAAATDEDFATSNRSRRTLVVADRSSAEVSSLAGMMLDKAKGRVTPAVVGSNGAFAMCARICVIPTAALWCTGLPYLSTLFNTGCLPSG